MRTIGKVASTYKKGDKKSSHTFRAHGAITYDDRILTWNNRFQEISIWVLGGRQKINFVCGERDYELLRTQKGESDLCMIDGQFYIFTTCEVETPVADEAIGYLGVDLGIVNIATDSDGTQYSGRLVNALRYRHRRLRKRLQSKNTRSALRKLRRRRHKESRFAKDVNHCIAKKLVGCAKDTHRGIALELLGGIRERLTVHKAQRDLLTNWSFHDLRRKIEYKARISGVVVVLVDPRNTSRTCPICGCIDKYNRRTQALFQCVSCGYRAHADHNAACIIASRAAVNPPNAPPFGVTMQA